MTPTPPEHTAAAYQALVANAPPLLTNNNDRVEVHTPCLLCGYDLFGLAADSPCPECAEPIAASLHPTPQKLWGTPAARNTARGGTILGTTYIFLIPFAGILIPLKSLPTILPITLWVGFWCILTSLGWWLIATPGKHGRYTNTRLCWTVRTAAVIYALSLPTFVLTLNDFITDGPLRLLAPLSLAAFFLAAPIRLTAGLILIRARLLNRPDSGRLNCTIALSLILAIAFLIITSMLAGPPIGTILMCITIPAIVVAYIAVIGVCVSLMNITTTRTHIDTSPPTTHTPAAPAGERVP